MRRLATWSCVVAALGSTAPILMVHGRSPFNGDGNGNGDGDGPDTDQTRVDIALKLGAAAILLVVAIVSGLIPIYWKKLRDSPLALSYLNAFAGGVFLSMS